MATSARRAVHVMYVIAGGLAGIGGALAATAVGHIDPEMAYWTTSGEFIFIAILAGTGNVIAPFVGALIYGAILPAGLFIYWIVFTLYSIVQQYLFTGWGALFPLFGWTPGFVQDHQPRFPVAYSAPAPTSADSGASRRSETDSRTATDRAAGTIKPARQRARTSRRGRRR